MDSIYVYIYILVGGLEHEFYFPIQLGIIIPFDELIFFRGVGNDVRQFDPHSNRNILIYIYRYIHMIVYVYSDIYSDIDSDTCSDICLDT